MAVTLMTIGVVAVLAFCAVSASITCLDVSVGLDLQQRCRNLAECAVAHALDLVLADASFQKDVYTPPVPDGSQGVVTFSHGLSIQGRAIPWSTNNAGGSSPQAGFHNEAVPLQCVDLIGSGLVHGHMESIEAVLQLPRFPYAIATSGTFASTGDLEVGDV
ncbi:MAG: hypothetical protein ACYCW6_08640, partial [Candidatus Xenobia bacterium]